MKTYLFNKGFIVQKTKQGITIFDGERSILYSFNTIASYIFTRLKKGDVEDVIVESLKKQYPQKLADDLKKDVLSFISILEEKRIVKKSI